MTSDASKKKRSHHSERITLDSEAFERIERWVGQIQPHLKGSRLTRSDLVNEIIKRRPAELSAAELKAITASYFDPARALLWAAKEVKAAQKSGQQVDLGQLLQGSGLPRQKKKPGKTKKTSGQKTGSEFEGNQIL